MKRVIRIVVPMVFLLVVTSCTSTFKDIPVSPGGIYRNGTLRALIGLPLPRVQDGIKAVMEDLDFVAIDVVSDKLRGEIRARMADGTRVKVKTEAEDFESTNIRIEIGTFGNEAVSTQVYRHILKKLHMAVDTANSTEGKLEK